MKVSIDRHTQRSFSPWGQGAGVAWFPWPEVHLPKFLLAFATIEKTHTSFTTFPGKQRLFTLLEGSCGLLVNTDRMRPERLTLQGEFPSCGFDAAVKTDCLLSSESALAFNIIYQPTSCSVKAETVDARNEAQRLSFGSAINERESETQHTFVLCLQGSAKVESSLFKQESLARLDLLHIELANTTEQAELHFSQGAQLLVAQLTL